MMSVMRRRVSWWTCALAVGAAAPLAAQPAPRDHVFFAAGPHDPMVGIVGVEDAFEGKVVKGAPYQAEAVTEVTQTLADGNRIVRKTTASVYRDGEGRTRREHGLAAIGPLVPDGDLPRMVFIHDPVAGVGYVLEADHKIARKLDGHGPHGMGPGWHHGSDAAGRGAFTRRLPDPTGAGSKKDAQTESLGTQTIEGLEAVGTRSTVTIAAGQIGNEKPIQIVSERWYSPELKVVVQSRHRDPRMGETLYRLTNIARGEPDRSLFEVPAGYTVSDGPPAFRKRKAE